MHLKRSEFEKRIKRVLNEEETMLLSLIVLSNMQDDDKYKNISELIFLFDNYKGFKQFIKYYEGQTITVPTVKEIKQSLRLLDLFQKVIIDKKDFNTCYENSHLAYLDLSPEYCKQEINKFKDLLLKDGNNTLKQIKKIKRN